MAEANGRTLYVGNLCRGISEALLVALFAQIGTVHSCQVIRKSGNDPYAIVEYTDFDLAEAAVTLMNKRVFFDREIKVKWFDCNKCRVTRDMHNYFHVFVGDLSDDVTTDMLCEAFGRFGQMAYCRVVSDPATQKSRGYAFVTYLKRADAEAAIRHMNGKYLGSRMIRTNWSTRKTGGRHADGRVAITYCDAHIEAAVSARPHSRNYIRPTYAEVFHQSSTKNKTVYCGGFPPNCISGTLLQRLFESFGAIRCIRIFKAKGFAFVRFYKKESAALAIVKVHNTEVAGCLVKCCWSRENGGDIIINNTLQETGQGRAVVGCGGGDADSAMPMSEATGTEEYATGAQGPVDDIMVMPQMQQQEEVAPDMVAQPQASGVTPEYQYTDVLQQPIMYYYPAEQSPNVPVEQEQAQNQNQAPIYYPYVYPNTTYDANNYATTYDGTYNPNNYYSYSDPNYYAQYNQGTQPVVTYIPVNYQLVQLSDGNWAYAPVDGYTTAVGAYTYAPTNSYYVYDNTTPQYQMQ